MAETRRKLRDEVTFFETAAAFRRWLAANWESADELWVGFFKKGSGKATVTYSEAVDEALCFGWIDGIRLTVDDECFTNRFTRRKAGSNWSAVNVRRVKALLASGRMEPPGIAAFEARDPDKTQAIQDGRAAGLAPEYERVLRSEAEAWAFFESQPGWYQRTAGGWVSAAKREETRQGRLRQLIEDSAAGLWVRPLRRGQPGGRGSGGRLR